jgi:hypothetical protein
MSEPTAVPMRPAARGIRVRRLRLHGTDRYYEVNFVDPDTNQPRPLSVISGAFSTGKTAVLEFIDYCLGASEHPKHPEVMRKVKAATVEVDLSGTSYLIERTVGEPSSHALIRPGHLDDGGGPPTERRPIRPPGAAESLSSFLLSQCGLEGVQLREAPTQSSSDTDPLSFRDLMWLCFLPNERLASKALLFESIPPKKLKLRQVVDIIFDVHDDRAAELGRRLKEMETRLAKARATYEAAQQIVEEQQLGGRLELEADRDRSNAELASVDQALTVVDQRARSATAFADELRRRHRTSAATASRAEALLRDRETQLRRMTPLRAQYADDVAKLTMLAEAPALFDPLHAQACPACLGALQERPHLKQGRCSLCGNAVRDSVVELTLGQAESRRAAAEHGDQSNGHRKPATSTEAVTSVAPDDISPAFDVGTELRATKTRLAELTRFVEELDRTVGRLRVTAQRAREEEAAAAAEVDNATTAVISPYIAERDALTRRRESAAKAQQRAEAGLQMISSLERRANDVARQEVAVRALREEMHSAATQQPDRPAIVRAISDRYRDILTAWKYPKLADAYLADDLTPFMRGNRYQAASSGGRTLISLAWTLAIFEIAWESGGTHPGFLFLDSPQKNLGQTGDRDVEFADAVTIADIYHHLQHWLDSAGAGTQIIVADNAPPPEALADVVIHFSRRADQPPYGLIDDETS